MTEVASIPPAGEAPALVVKRRLIGLGVLLLGLFLLGFLLRQQNENAASDAVVIALQGAGSAPADPVKASAEAPVLSESATAPAAASNPPTASWPATAELPDRPAPPRAEPPSQSASPEVTARKPASKPAPRPTAIAKDKPAAATRWFVVVGAYKDPMAAEAIKGRVALAGMRAQSLPITSGKERLHRVRAGPFADKSAAEAARVTLIVEGLTKAVLVSEK